MSKTDKSLKVSPQFSHFLLVAVFILILGVGIYLLSVSFAATSYPTSASAVVLENVVTDAPDFGHESELAFTKIQRLHGNGLLVCTSYDPASATQRYQIGIKVLSSTQISSTLDQVKSAGFYSLAAEYPATGGKAVAYADYILANPSTGPKRTVLYPRDGVTKPTAYSKTESIIGGLCTSTQTFVPKSLSVLVTDSLRTDISEPAPPAVSWSSSVLPLSSLLSAATSENPVVTYSDPLLIAEILLKFGVNTRVSVATTSGTRYLLLDKHLPPIDKVTLNDGAVIDVAFVDDRDPNAAYAATKYPVKFTWVRGENQSLHSTYADNNDYIARVIRNRYEDWSTKYFRFVNSDNPTTSYKSTRTTHELRSCSNCGSDVYKYAEKILNRLINELDFETQSIKNLQLLAQFPARPSGDSDRCGPGITYAYSDKRAIGITFGIQNCIKSYPSTNRFATAAHELGHGFRLDHAGEKNYVMNYSHCWSTKFTTDCRMVSSQKTYLKDKSPYFNN